MVSSEQGAQAPPEQAPPVITDARLASPVAQLPAVVRGAMRRTGIPGVAVAVVWHDRVVFLKGFGVREKGTSSRVTADTVFQLASVAKPLASTVVAGVVGQGKLAWDDPVVRYSPAFALGDAYVTQNVTVADLMSHRSGLPAQAGDYLQYVGYDRDDIVSRLRLLPLSTFRSSYAYGNFGFAAGAFAAAAAAGTDWADLGDQLLYKPLGMTATSSRFADYEASDNKARTHVRIGRHWVAKYTFNDDAASPAGGVSSTARDLTKWMRLQLANGSFEGTQIIDADALARTHFPASVKVPPPVPGGRARFYGLGWDVGYDALGRATWDHSGEFWSGAGTTFSLLPTEELGIVVLTNAIAIGAAEAITADFNDRATYGKPTVDWLRYVTKLFAQSHTGSGPDYATPPANAAPPRPDSTYVGTYANDYYGEIFVVATNGGLGLQIGPSHKEFELRHYDADTFSYVPIVEQARSGVVFTVPAGTPAASQVTIELLKEEGFGDFTRTTDEPR
jgi:CubicO group peptidase (beta-lactamase class C family)